MKKVTKIKHPSRKKKMEQQSRPSLLFLSIISCLIITTVIGISFYRSILQGIQGASSASNPIQQENALAGTSSWSITNPSRVSSHDIEGFASRQSAKAGDTVSFYVKTAQSGFTADFYRLGWYNGVGGRYVGLSVHSTNTNASSPIPTPNPTTGLVAANWSVSFNATIPSNWTTGLYVVKLSANNSGYQSYIPFVVTKPSYASPYVTIHSDNADQAYNNYGGASLYGDNTKTLALGRATQVSFNRPYIDNAGYGHSLSWEYPFVRWMEKQGYDTTYLSDHDLDENPSYLTSHKGIIVVGHPEYWSTGMRSAVDNAIANGVNFADFAANGIYWHIRYDSTRRIIICYKDPQTNGNYIDPVYATDHTQDTSQWRTGTASNYPEQFTLGSMYSSYLGDSSKTAPWVAANVSSWPTWLSAGTNLQNGTTIPGIVGYEYDKYWNGYNQPKNVLLVASSPLVNVYGVSDIANSTLYQSSSNAWIFNAGTVDWGWGLDNWAAPFSYYPNRPAVANTSIQELTANIFNKFSIAVAPTATPTLPPTPTPTIDPNITPTDTPIPTNTPVPTPTSTPAPPTPTSSLSYYQSVLKDGPISYYRLDDKNTIVSTAVNAITGTYINSPLESQQGALANPKSNDTDPSVWFNKTNGLNQYADITYNSALNTAKFSVEAWVYPIANGGSSRYWGIVASRKYPLGWTLYVNNNDTNNPYYTFWINNGSGIMATGNTGAGVHVTTNTWTHLVATFDGTNEKLYVNGNYVASSSVSSYSSNNGTDEAIGQGEPGSGFYFPGKIDDVSFYNYALSQTQITNHYHAAGY